MLPTQAHLLRMCHVEESPCRLVHVHCSDAWLVRCCPRRRFHAVFCYVFDIVLPAPVYAPLFGFLLRLASPF